MINYVCSNVLVNNQDTSICDLKNTCLNVGDTLGVIVNGTFSGTCSLFDIITSGYDSESNTNYIVISGSHCELDGTEITIQNPCIPITAHNNPYTTTVIECVYNAELNQTVLYIAVGSKGEHFGACPADCESCGFISATANTLAWIRITNTTTAQQYVYENWLNQNVDELYNFIIPSFGDYAVEVGFKNFTGTTCEEIQLCEYTFKACPPYRLTKESCHNYCLHDDNPFSKTNYVTVEGPNNYVANYQFTVPYETEVCFTTPADGVYTTTVTHDNYSACNGQCINQNGTFDTDLNWWCQGPGDTDPSVQLSTTCNPSPGNLYFEWSSENGGSAFNIQANMTDQPNILGQSCLTIGKTYCISLDIRNFNQLIGSYQTHTDVEIYVGDTLITKTQMPELYMMDTSLTTHNIFIPAVTCTNTIHPLNNWFIIKIANGGSDAPESLFYIDNVCIREVQNLPVLQDSYTEIIYDLCDMAACIKKLILDLFCNEDDPCCNDCDPAKEKAKELYRNELNKLNALYSTFSMMIEKEKADYLNVFTMDSCRELMISEIQSVFTKINEITKRCGDCDPKTNVTTPSSGCNGC